MPIGRFLVVKHSSTLYTRRRWLQTAGLWSLAASFSLKGASTLTRREREQLENGLTRLGKSLNEIKTDLATKWDEVLASQPAPPPRQPSLQELHPELYQGDYAQFLDNYSFRYIRTHEIITPHCRTRLGISNRLPPKNLWHNVTSTLKFADEIRHRWGTPLDYITSAYRTPAYNKQCGGASRSFHTRNNALDLVYAAGSEDAFEVALQLRKEKFFKGGVGFYPGFIHIDTRGYNATWEA